MDFIFCSSQLERVKALKVLGELKEKCEWRWQFGELENGFRNQVEMNSSRLESARSLGWACSSSLGSLVGPRYCATSCPPSWGHVTGVVPAVNKWSSHL